MWPEEPVVAKHASPRNDEEAFEYPLQRAVSFRRRMSEDPHFKQTKSFSFMAASIRTLLPAMVRRHHRRSRKAPRGSDLWGRKEWAKAVYDLDIPSRRSIIYLEMMKFSLTLQHKVPFQTVILRLGSRAAARLEKTKRKYFT